MTTNETLPETLRTIARKWIERRDALGLKGKKADDAALNYCVGAAVGAEAAGDALLASTLGRCAVLDVAFRGDIAMASLWRVRG